MDATRELIVEFLTRFEKRLLQRGGLAQLNALMSLGDPTLVLPSPALALLAVSSEGTLTLGPSHAFRSVEPLAADGDVIFSPIAFESTIHPWEVSKAEFLAGDPSGSARPRLRLELTRPMESSCAAGWLSLHADGGSLLTWALGRAIASCDGMRLRVRRPAHPRIVRTFASRLSPLHRHLLALLDSLLEIEIPATLASRTKLDVVLHLDDGLVIPAQTGAVRVRANVVPVWNVLECRAPSYLEAERALGAQGDRFVHPLVPHGLGAAWKAWSVLRVGSGSDAGVRFSHRPLSARAIDGSPGETYRLAYVPAEEVSGSSGVELPRDLPVLTVVLSPEAMATMAREASCPVVDFLATPGARDNGLVPGTDFQLVDTSGIPVLHRCTGSLVHATFGGLDGIAPVLESLPKRLGAFMPVAGHRTIGDLWEIFEYVFGRDLEIVDEGDFIRTSRAGTVTGLHVRVRFRRPGRPAMEKRVMLLACQSFFEMYLDGNPGGTIVLAEEEGRGRDALAN